MITLKLKIKNKIDVTQDCENYSYMFRKLYSNFELGEDKNFQKELREKFNLDSWIFESCKTEVKMKIEQKLTFDEQNKNELEKLEKELLEYEFKEGLQGRRRKFKVNKKIKNIKSSIGREITFGTRELIKRISFLSNPISKNILKNLSSDEIQKIEQQKIENLEEYKKEYKNSRLLSLYIVGETLSKSNRKFDFDFENKKMIFKPKYGTKIPIEFYCGKGQYEQLCNLQSMIGKKQGEAGIPISVRLSNEYVWITFDEEKLNGFAFNETEYFKELKTIPKKNKQERKDCYIKWIREQESRMLLGKIKDRFISFDLNPEYIGFSILDKVNESDLKIIHKECISFENLNIKLGLSSTDLAQIKQNNKRIHELREVWQYIFNIAKHYQVSNCSIEDLEFQEKSVNENSKEANRKTKNLWHRTLTTNSIKKYCNTIGIKLIPVNPCYSSFIGNIKHNYFDPVSSAIEIGRRGITKYLKGSFYPTLERIDFDTMYHLGLDVQNKTISNWVQAFKHFKTSGLRYRRELKDFVENNFRSHKSDVKSYHFYDL